jgi:hypothetical protein
MGTRPEVPLLRTFNLRETCQLCGITPTRLYIWIDHGRLVPAIRGRGRGNQHRFTFQQVLGIAAASSLILTRDASVEYTKAVLALFSNMTDAALEHWLEQETPHTEEAYAKWKMNPILHDQGNAKLPDHHIAMHDLVARLQRVERAIKARLGIGRGLEIRSGVFTLGNRSKRRS